MDAGAILAYLELTAMGLLMLVVVPVLLTMGAAAFAPMLAALKRAALGLGRPTLHTATVREASFDHLPRALASFGHDTVALLEELDHFSQVTASISTSRLPRSWSRIGATFGDASGYQAETRTAEAIWRWVFAAERLPAHQLEDLRALDIDPRRVRAELLAAASLRARLPSLLAELERVTDTLAGYTSTAYRGQSLGQGRPQLPAASDAAPSSRPEQTEDLRRRRYGEIERRYGRLLHRIAARHTRCPSDRDDLLQDIRLAIWNALPAYRGDSSLRTYAVRIAQNRAATALRRSRAPSHLSVSELPDARPDLDQQLDAAARHGWLTRALTKLSPGIADVFERRLAGDSYREIADALCITTSNVGVRLHTGKAKLKALAAEER